MMLTLIMTLRWDIVDVDNVIVMTYVVLKGYLYEKTVLFLFY